MTVVGDIVLVHLRTHFGEPRHINGSSTAPAIVTAVHSDNLINCKMFADNQEAPEHLTSLPLIGSHEDWKGDFWEPRARL